MAEPPTVTVQIKNGKEIEMKSNLVMASVIFTAFFLNGCDQKPAPEQVNCSKPVSQMSKEEINTCGKGGEYSKGPNKKW